MVEINFFTLAIQWLNFGILLFLLNRLLFKPLLAFLDARSGEIKTDMDQAKEKNTKATELLASYEAKMKSAQREAEVFMEQVRKDAATERNRLLKSAQAEVEGMLERGRSEIATEVSIAKDKLRQEFSGAAVRCAEKILEKEVRPGDHSNLVASFLAQELK